MCDRVKRFDALPLAYYWMSNWIGHWADRGFGDVDLDFGALVSGTRYSRGHWVDFRGDFLQCRGGDWTVSEEGAVGTTGNKNKMPDPNGTGLSNVAKASDLRIL